MNAQIRVSLNAEVGDLVENVFDEVNSMGSDPVLSVSPERSSYVVRSNPANLFYVLRMLNCSVPLHAYTVTYL